MTFAMGGILHTGSRDFGPVLCLLLGPPALHDDCGPHPDEEAGHQCDTAITNHSHKEFPCDWDVGRLRPSTLGTAERSYPTSEVRSRGRSARLRWRGSGREELPKYEVRGGREKPPRTRG